MSPRRALRDLEAELSDPATVASSLTRQEVAAAITTQRRALEAASLQVSRLRAAERDADIRFRAAERLAQRQQQVVSAHQAAVQHAERSQAAVRPPGAAAGTTTTAATPAKPTSAGSRRTPRAAEVAAAAVSGTDADRAAHGSAASGPIPPFATHDEATWRRLGLVMFEEQQRRANAQAEKEGRPATGFLPRHIIRCACSGGVSVRARARARGAGSSPPPSLRSPSSPTHPRHPTPARGGSWVYLCVNPDQQALTAEETAAIEQQVVEFREQQGLQEDDEPTLFKGFLTRGRALKFVTALSEDLARARQGGAAKDEL